MAVYRDSSLHMQGENDSKDKNLHGHNVLALVRHVSQMGQEEEKCLFCSSLII